MWRRSSWLWPVLVPWAGLAVLSAVLEPGASFLFVWPLIGSTLVLGGLILRGMTGDAQRVGFMTLGAVPAAIVVVPTARLDRAGPDLATGLDSWLGVGSGGRAGGAGARPASVDAGIACRQWRWWRRCWSRSWRWYARRRVPSIHG